jgi:copper chaperone NosL
MKPISIIALALGLILGACAADEVAEGPPEINYGRDICVECGMIINEARYAAAYRLPNGTEEKFDDLGGLLIHGHEQGELADAEVWVHDVETEAWVRAEDAWYVMTKDGRTPMGYGIIAFADHQRAQDVAEGLGAEVLGWEVIMTMTPEPSGHSQHG